jgi:hypothetical protein
MTYTETLAEKAVEGLGIGFGGTSQVSPHVLGQALAGQINNGGWALIATASHWQDVLFRAWEGDGDYWEDDDREAAKAAFVAGFEATILALGLSLEEVYAAQPPPPAEPPQPGDHW